MSNSLALLPFAELERRIARVGELTDSPALAEEYGRLVLAEIRREGRTDRFGRVCHSTGVLAEGLRPLTGSVVAVILGIFGKTSEGPFAWGCAAGVVLLAAVTAVLLIRMADEWMRAHTRGRVKSELT